MKLLALPSLLLLAASALAQVDPDRVVAVLNGEEIKGAEYYRRMETLDGVGRQFGAVYSEMPPGVFTLNALITERLLLQLARDKGVYPSDVEVAKELEYRLKKNPNFVNQAKQKGKTEEDVRHEVRLSLANYKLQTYGITIADGEIDAYYAARPERFTIPKRLKLRVIAVATHEDVTKVDKELSSGKPFAEVAKAHSLDAGASQGGEFRTVAADTLAPALKSAVGDLKKGQVSTWVTLKQGEQESYLKFLVDDILPETKQKLDADVRREVRQELALQRGRIKNDLGKELKDMRRKAKVDIKSPEFAAAYRVLIEQFLGLGPDVPAPGGGGSSRN